MKKIGDSCAHDDRQNQERHRYWWHAIRFIFAMHQIQGEAGRVTNPVNLQFNGEMHRSMLVVATNNNANINMEIASAALIAFFITKPGTVNRSASILALHRNAAHYGYAHGCNSQGG